MAAKSGTRAWFAVRRIGGIRETKLELTPGVTVLSGRNATNRTSFLQSIRAALGSEAATLKGDAESGQVTMQLDGKRYERRLERTDGEVVFAGDSYLEDPTVADLFAFLLETNDARQAVARHGDLRDLIMRPVDTDAINAEIDELERRKEQLGESLSAIESRKRELTDLEQRRATLRDRIEAKREKLAEKEAEIDDVDIEQHRKDKTAFEETLDTLRETRGQLASVRDEIAAQSESIASLEREQSEVTAALADLESAEHDRTELDAEIARLREQRQSLNGEIAELGSLIQYNRDRLQGDQLGALLGEEAEETSLTGRLVDDETVTCWTCGTVVERDQIRTTVERLEDLREQKRAELATVKSTLTEQKSDKQAIERTERRREELAAKQSELSTEQQRRERRLDTLRERRSELTDEVESLEQRVDSLESEEFEAVLSLHREANELEFELDSLTEDLEDVADEIADVEAEIERADDLRAERERVAERLTEKRTEIDRIEATAVTEFNEHMTAILDVLGYENIERIWIERVADDGRGGEQQRFELHVVRTTESGAAYEDTVDHLSESEREVTGLIFALAGYLVHDVHETVPFMLLDSLEAIDADRIARLVDYFAEYATYLVVALLPEDAEALDSSCSRITEI
jgi:DNA repair exonuclease SbcCD ATPase subunit